jgi:hypothetical protein
MAKPKADLVAEPIVRARMRHVLPPSRIVEPLIALGRLLMPAYLRVVLQFRKIEVLHMEELVDALRDFQEGRTRLVVAFRHAYGDESMLLFHVFDNMVQRWTATCGKPLPRRPHLRVLHDYAVPLWGDAFIRFVLPRVGAVPIYHVKFDPASLKTIRGILTDDPSPLGLAPEGQVSYRSEILPRIEQGTVRMAFWCARDLDRAKRPEKTVVLPMSIHYRYHPGSQRKVFAALDRLDALCGRATSPVPARLSRSPSSLPIMQERLEAIEARVLEVAEDFYAKSYGFKPKPATGPVADEGLDRQRRWEALQEVALDAAENALGLPHDGEDRIQRVYRIRQEGWDRIYPEISLEGLTPLETAMAHRRTGEAWYAMRHMEFVDLTFYLDAAYLRGAEGSAPSFDRIVETTVNLQDLVARLMGGNYSNRPNEILKDATLIPGRLIDITSRFADYQKDSKKASREATTELESRFNEGIKEYMHERQE